MKKVVFFTDTKYLQKALNYFQIDSFSDKKVPIKLHMGEVKNKFFTRPELVKQVVDVLKKINVKPFLFDTTVAYTGLRSTKSGYEKVANMHGFNQKKVGCNVIIDDTGISTLVENREYEVAVHLVESTHILAVSHVKGHIATGMGGTIKNFGINYL